MITLTGKEERQYLRDKFNRDWAFKHPLFNLSKNQIRTLVARVSKKHVGGVFGTLDYYKKKGNVICLSIDYSNLPAKNKTNKLGRETALEIQKQSGYMAQFIKWVVKTEEFQDEKMRNPIQYKTYHAIIQIFN